MGKLMAKLTNLHVCRAFFKMRFQEDLVMTEDEYLTLKSLYRSMKHLDLLPSCGWENNLLVCRTLFKIRFQEDLVMTDDEYLTLKNLYKPMCAACQRLIDLLNDTTKEAS